MRDSANKIFPSNYFEMKPLFPGTFIRTHRINVRSSALWEILCKRISASGTFSRHIVVGHLVSSRVLKFNF